MFEQDGPELDRLVKDSMKRVLQPLLEATRYPREKRLDRDVLGRVVRKAWIEWASQQPDPKASWLVPYEELDEHDKEADRLIGERVLQYVKIVLKLDMREFNAVVGKLVEEDERSEKSLIGCIECGSPFLAPGEDPPRCRSCADGL